MGCVGKSRTLHCGLTIYALKEINIMMLRVLILLFGVFSTGFACGSAFLKHSLSAEESAIEVVQERKIFLQSEKMTILRPAPACTTYDPSLSFVQNLHNCNWTEPLLLDI